MHKTEDKHIFAVYVGDLFAKQKGVAGSSVLITDQNVVHRIVTVLRLQVGQELILFDDAHHYQVTISDIKKNKAIIIKIDAITQNAQSELEINFVLPVLKKEALEEAVYSLAEIGVACVQLIITTKSQKNISDKDLERLQKMKIAAAQQSKNFAMPAILKPIAFEKFSTAFETDAYPALLFDPSGKPAAQIIGQLQQQKVKKIACLIGPEGGLTALEIQVVSRIGFKACKLTPTVLRAVQAAAVGAGMLASLL